MPLKTLESEMNKLSGIIDRDDEQDKYMMKEINDYADRQDVNIAIIGVGNAGANMATNVALTGSLEAKIFVVESNAKHLLQIESDMKAAKDAGKKVTPIIPILIGKNITGGLGTGGDPWKSYRAIMEEDKNTIERIVKDADLVIILTGLGGGTGTGAAPAIAKIARERGNSTFVSTSSSIKKEPLILSIATLPFSFEKMDRRKKALIGLDELFKYSHSVIVIENDSIRELFGKMHVDAAFRMSDILVARIAAGISQMLSSNLKYNVDFADMYRLMHDAGMSYVGIGESNSSNKIVDAVKEAISQPLIRKSMILDEKNAKGAIVYFEVPPRDKDDDFPLEKFSEATEVVSELVREDGGVKWAIKFDVDDLCLPNESSCYVRALTIIAGVKTEYIDKARQIVKKEGGFERFFKNYTTKDKKDVEIISNLFEPL